MTPIIRAPNLPLRELPSEPERIPGSGAASKLPFATLMRRAQLEIGDSTSQVPWSAKATGLLGTGEEKIVPPEGPPDFKAVRSWRRPAGRSLAKVAAPTSRAERSASKPDAGKPSPTPDQAQNDQPEGGETPVHAPVPPQPANSLRPSINTHQVPGQTAPGAKGSAGGSSGNAVDGSTSGPFAPHLPADGRGTQPISSPALAVLTQASTSPAGIPEPATRPLSGGTKRLSREAKAPVVAARGEGEPAAVGKPAAAGQLDETPSSVARQSMASLPMPEKPVTDTPSLTPDQAVNDRPERRVTPVHISAPPHPVNSLRPSINTHQVPGQTAPGAKGSTGGSSGNAVDGSTSGPFAPHLPADGRGTQPISSPALAVLTQASTSPAGIPEPATRPWSGGTKRLSREAKAPVVAARGEGEAAAIAKPAAAGQLDETPSSVARQSMASLPMPEKPVTDTASPTLAQAQNDQPEGRGTPVHISAPPHPVNSLRPSIKTNQVPGQTTKGQGAQPISSPVVSELAVPSTSPAGVPEPSTGSLAGGTKSTLHEGEAPVVAAEGEGQAAAVGKPAAAGRLDETASSVAQESMASLQMPQKPDADTPSPTPDQAQNDQPEGRETLVYASVPPHPMDALPPSLETDDLRGQTASRATKQATQPSSSPVSSELTEPSTSPAGVREPSKGPLAGGTNSPLREAKAPVVAAEAEGQAAAVGKPAEPGRLDKTASSVAQEPMASLQMPEKPDADKLSPTLAQAQNDQPEGRETPVYASVPPHPMDALPPSLQTDDLRGQTASRATKQATQPSSSPVSSELTEPSTSPAGVREPSRGPLAGGMKSASAEAKAPVVAAEAEGDAAAVGKPAAAGRSVKTASSVAQEPMASLQMPEKPDADMSSPALGQAQNDPPERRGTPVHISPPPQPMAALRPSIRTGEVPGQTAQGANGVGGGLSGNVVEGNLPGRFAPYLPANGQGTQPISSPVLAVLTQASTSPAEVPEPSKRLAGWSHEKLVARG